MTEVATHPGIESLLQGGRGLPQGPARWLNERRAQALERANALTVPTTRDEEWRFTDITPLTRIHFQPVQEPAETALSDIGHFLVPEVAARLVFVDGIFAPEISAFADPACGVRVERLAEALSAQGAALEQHLTGHAAFDDNLFAALNTSYLHDGALVIAEKNRTCAAPIHLLFVATRKEIAVYPRCLVVAETGSGCMVIEDYVSLTDGVYFTNAVTEIAVAARARVRH